MARAILRSYIIRRDAARTSTNYLVARGGVNGCLGGARVSENVRILGGVWDELPVERHPGILPTIGKGLPSAARTRLSRRGARRGFQQDEAAHVGSKLKCPLFVASEMSGFKVVPSPVGAGWFWGWGAGEGGSFPFPCSALY